MADPDWYYEPSQPSRGSKITAEQQLLRPIAQGAYRDKYAPGTADYQVGQAVDMAFRNLENRLDKAGETCIRAYLDWGTDFWQTDGAQWWNRFFNAFWRQMNMAAGNRYSYLVDQSEFQVPVPLTMPAPLDDSDQSKMLRKEGGQYKSVNNKIQLNSNMAGIPQTYVDLFIPQEADLPEEFETFQQYQDMATGVMGMWMSAKKKRAAMQLISLFSRFVVGPVADNEQAEQAGPDGEQYPQFIFEDGGPVVDNWNAIITGLVLDRGIANAQKRVGAAWGTPAYAWAYRYLDETAIIMYELLAIDQPTAAETRQLDEGLTQLLRLFYEGEEDSKVWRKVNDYVLWYVVENEEQMPAPFDEETTDVVLEESWKDADTEAVVEANKDQAPAAEDLSDFGQQELKKAQKRAAKAKSKEVAGQGGDDADVARVQDVAIEMFPSDPEVRGSRPAGFSARELVSEVQQVAEKVPQFFQDLEESITTLNVAGSDAVLEGALLEIGAASAGILNAFEAAPILDNLSELYCSIKNTKAWIDQGPGGRDAAVNAAQDTLVTLTEFRGYLSGEGEQQLPRQQQQQQQVSEDEEDEQQEQQERLPGKGTRAQLAALLARERAREAAQQEEVDDDFFDEDDVAGDVGENSEISEVSEVDEFQREEPPAKRLDTGAGSIIAPEEDAVEQDLAEMVNTMSAPWDQRCWQNVADLTGPSQPLVLKICGYAREKGFKIVPVDPTQYEDLVKLASSPEIAEQIKTALEPLVTDLDQLIIDQAAVVRATKNPERKEEAQKILDGHYEELERVRGDASRRLCRDVDEQGRVPPNKPGVFVAPATVEDATKMRLTRQNADSDVWVAIDSISFKIIGLVTVAAARGFWPGYAIAPNTPEGIRFEKNEERGTVSWIKPESDGRQTWKEATEPGYQRLRNSMEILYLCAEPGEKRVGSTLLLYVLTYYHQTYVNESTAQYGSNVVLDTAYVWDNIEHYGASDETRPYETSNLAPWANRTQIKNAAAIARNPNGDGAYMLHAPLVNTVCYYFTNFDFKLAYPPEFLSLTNKWCKDYTKLRDKFLALPTEDTWAYNIVKRQGKQAPVEPDFWGVNAVLPMVRIMTREYPTIAELYELFLRLGGEIKPERPVGSCSVPGAQTMSYCAGGDEVQAEINEDDEAAQEPAVKKRAVDASQ